MLPSKLFKNNQPIEDNTCIRASCHYSVHQERLTYFYRCPSQYRKLTARCLYVSAGYDGKQICDPVTLEIVANPFKSDLIL